MHRSRAGKVALQRAERTLCIKRRGPPLRSRLRAREGEESAQSFAALAKVAAHQPEWMQRCRQSQSGFGAVRVLQTERQRLAKIVVLALQSVQPPLLVG